MSSPKQSLEVVGDFHVLYAAERSFKNALQIGRCGPDLAMVFSRYVMKKANLQQLVPVKCNGHLHLTVFESHAEELNFTGSCNRHRKEP